MAIFSNQATLTYNGNTTNSNIAYGEILNAVTATKTAIEENYAPSETVTYVVSLRNTGPSAVTGLTVTDDLGGYEFDGETVYPLTYTEGSAVLFVNGVPQAAPTVTAGPPLEVTGITIPAGGNVLLIYQAEANGFADPSAEGTITNTVTVTGAGISTPVTASETVEAFSEADLTITKSISPTQVVDNERVTYTFVIRNTGSQAVDATDNAQITDTFDPILTDLTVTFNGEVWTEGVEYTYDETTGLFATVPGFLTVPAAAFTRDPETGEYSATPGIATLVVTGTI